MSTCGPARFWEVAGQTLDKKYYFVKRRPNNYYKNRPIKYKTGFVMAHLVDRECPQWEVHSESDVARREA